MSVENLQQFLARWLGPVEDEMRAALHSDDIAVAAHYGMMSYHMGWADASFRAENLPSGKRLRPLLCLLACQEVGGDPRRALPAAAAVEILHNFSLVHDDVEDGDELRRHRPTVWALWGVPQAVNVGDGMFALAFGALQRLPQAGVDAPTTLAALRNFTDMCLALTEGQHLDMSFERRADVTVVEYLRMIRGKTAALIGASLAIGGLVGGATRTQDRALQRFGQAIGFAFQIQDDLLGIWGDPAVTGKAAGNDLLRKKKSYPLLHALNDAVVGPELNALLARPDFGPAKLPTALALLDQTQARAATETEMRVRYEEGMAALRAALGPQAEDSLLWAFAEWLLRRQA
jgi:geranylgeranyl diphosphate synthase type I